MSNITEEPECYDEVKHKFNDTTGTVIAKYTMGMVTYLDVRGTDEKIHYASSIGNWEVVRKEVDTYE
jgi:hypothetical protein